MRTRLSHRARKSSFLVLEVNEGNTSGGCGGDEEDRIVWISGRRNLSQTALDLTTDLKLLETDDIVSAFRGMVSETTVAMHPSDKAYRSMRSPPPPPKSSVFS
ncbi:hypothetical protein ACFX2I_012539 [Malus domestica]